ncbi:MAG: hypothetical protein ABIH99_02955 [Candidatus Micrarchaeota archaeon]
MEVLLLISPESGCGAFQARVCPKVRIASNAYVFPLSALELVKSLASKKTKTLSASYGEGLEEANASWLAQKRVAVDVRGISYSVGFGEEMKLLKSWNAHGVKDDEEREYKTRVGVIASAFEKWKEFMFKTKELEELENALGELHA